MANLPGHILEEISIRLGEECLFNLRGLIFTGRRGRDAALSKSVLKSANLAKFKADPSLVMPNSPYRDIFVKCLNHKNSVALYLEGLRVGCFDGDVSRAADLFIEAAPYMHHASMALGLFLICGDSYYQGMMFLDDLWKEVTSLQAAIEIGDKIIENLSAMGPSGKFFYRSTFRYPNPPYCVIEGTWFPVCEECFVFKYAFKICSLC